MRNRRPWRFLFMRMSKCYHCSARAAAGFRWPASFTLPPYRREGRGTSKTWRIFRKKLRHRCSRRRPRRERRPPWRRHRWGKRLGGYGASSLYSLFLVSFRFWCCLCRHGLRAVASADRVRSSALLLLLLVVVVLLTSVGELLKWVLVVMAGVRHAKEDTMQRVFRELRRQHKRQRCCEALAVGVVVLEWPVLVRRLCCSKALPWLQSAKNARWRTKNAR